MKTEEFFRLTDKINDGTATDAELALYNQYFNHFQKERVWNDSTMGDEAERGALLYQSIHHAISTETPVRKLNTATKRILAAAAVLILVAGLALLFINRADQPLAHEVTFTSNGASSKTNDLIQLPDGSTVILSAGSTLKYASSFEGEPLREVFLTGKAFFDVKHLSNQPFIVHTGSVNTRVLGTAFNVDSGDDLLTVTVTRGKVVVNKEGRTLGTLTPNRQVVYNLHTDQAKLNHTNAETAVAWREEDLMFNDVTLSNAVLVLQDRFGVKVKIDNEELARQRFTTTLFGSQSLTDCLALICDFNNASYHYDHTTKQVIIKSKN